MRRSFLFASLAFLGVSSVAGAKCTDTLYLHSLTVYRQSLVNTATSGKWDSVVVDPRDTTSMLQAGPVSFAPYQQDYGYPANAMLGNETFHPLIFSSGCGTDSVSPVAMWRIVDTLNQVSQIKTVHAIGLSRISRNLKVSRMQNIYFTLGTQKLPLDFDWMSDLFDIGVAKGGSVVEGWNAMSVGFSFHHPVQVGESPLTNPPVYQTDRINPFSAMIDSYIASGLATMQKSVDSLGKGVVDSTRLEMVKYHYIYGFDKPASVVPRAGRTSAFSLVPTVAGWSISLPAKASVQVVGIDGRVIRQFPSNRTVMWDGRDAHGLKVRSGIWLIHAEGFGSVPVLVR